MYAFWQTVSYIKCIAVDARQWTETPRRRISTLTHPDELDTVEISVFHIQPSPAVTILARKRGVTAITRTWENGDHRRCRLCPTCHAIPEGVCMVVTLEDVQGSEAELYSLRDDRRATTLPCIAMVSSST
jgi:hypothetical protein